MTSENQNKFFASIKARTRELENTLNHLPQANSKKPSPTLFSSLNLTSEAKKEILNNLLEDPSIYDYDNYLNEKQEIIQQKKVNIPTKPENSRYQEKLLETSKRKKFEKEVYQDELRDKQLKRNTQTDDKPISYITEAYKEFLKEKQKFVSKESKESNLNSQNNILAFQRNTLGMGVNDETNSNKTEIKSKILEKKEKSSDSESPINSVKNSLEQERNYPKLSEINPQRHIFEPSETLSKKEKLEQARIKFENRKRQKQN